MSNIFHDAYMRQKTKLIQYCQYLQMKNSCLSIWNDIFTNILVVEIPVMQIFKNYMVKIWYSTQRVVAA